MDPHGQYAGQPTQYHQLQEKVFHQAPHHQQHQHPPVYAPQPASGPTILSIKRSTVLGFLGVLVVLFIAVIGLAAGLGVSQRNLSQAKTDLQFAQSAVAAATAGAVTTIYATRTGSSPTKTPTPAKSDIQCPRVNGTLYTAGANGTNATAVGGGKQFRLLCGFDYGKGEATDIGSVKVKNLNACADACAARANCTGAGWGVISGDSGPEHTCWLKTNLTRPHAATSDWGFAVLLGGNGTAITTGGGDDAE